MEDDKCPQCGGETTCGFGLAGGGTADEEGQTVPGVYFMCLDCDWASSSSSETICFPHGLTPDQTE